MTDVAVRHAGQDVAGRDRGGSGPDVMLLHGLGTDLASWDRVTPLVHDRMAALRRDLQRLPDARVVDLPGGHYGLLEEPAAVANLLLDACG